MFNPHNPEFWVMVAFFCFMGLLVYMKVPALLTKGLDDRAEAIRKELDEARRLREEAQQLLADYQKKAREAESEAKAMIDQARIEAEALAQESRRALTESLERRTKQAEDKIARAEAQALGEVRAAAVDVGDRRGRAYPEVESCRCDRRQPDRAGHPRSEGQAQLTGTGSDGTSSQVALTGSWSLPCRGFRALSEG